MGTTVSKQDERFRAYALEAPSWRVLLSSCGPLALFQALQNVFKILDSLMASYISADAVSAVACLSQITLMITALGTGLAVGGSIKISESYGKGDYAAVTRLVSTVYAMAVLVSIAVAAVLIPFAEGFLRLLNTPEDLIRTGVGYFRVEILTLVVSFFNTVFIAMERSRGHAKKILALNLSVAVVKLGLTALFVYGLGGGLMHIALATLAGQGLMLLYALNSIFRDEGAFRFRFREIHLRGKTMTPVLRLSYPLTAEKVLFAGGKVIINAMSGLYGALTVGALGISNNIGGLTTSWHMGFTDGAAPLISQNRGAGKYRRTLELYFWLLLIDVAIGLLGLGLVSRFLPGVAEIFARSKNTFDPAFRDAIVAIHRWEMVGYVTLGINSATIALLMGYGYTRRTMALNVARVFVFRVPVLWAFQNFTTLGPEAVGLTMMVSNVSTGLMAILVALPVIIQIRKNINH